MDEKTRDYYSILPYSSMNVSEAESETSNRSSTGKDFEMVDENDVDTS